MSTANDAVPDMLPKSFEELFDVLEKQIPGMEKLQVPLSEAKVMFLPLFKVCLLVASDADALFHVFIIFFRNYL